jgi:alkanesulfonate monooxygenase SsuD/methylene tetrahydromethanopterin reductase-like flavin-dependent oxidoreductase (luciferase family)
VRFSVALHNAYEGLGYPVGFVREGSSFARLARIAESLGFDGVWANDHLVAPAFLRDAGERPAFHEPLVTLASVAAATERVALGTAVIALPLREPTLLARQAATLQSLSGGRLRLGVGLGVYPEELATISPDHARHGRAALFDERFASLRRLLKDQATVGTAIPLYVGGHGVAAVERAARDGDGWLPGWQPLAVLREHVALLRERAAATGRDASAIAIAVELSARIEERHEDAVRRYESSRLVTHRRARDRSGRDVALMTASNLVGSAETIREKVTALAASGVDECAAIAFTSETQDELTEQWQRFAEAIIQAR